MPTRKGRRLRPRTARLELDLPIEWYLRHGACAGSIGPQTPSERLAAWQRFGAGMVRRYQEWAPGCRPGAFYEHAVGAPQLEERDMQGEVELAALIKSGHVDDGEARRARERIKKHGTSLLGVLPWINQKQ